MISALTSQEMPGDFAELVQALVSVRAYPDAAVEVHDQRVAARLVYLNLAEVVTKGLRGSQTLQSLFNEYGIEVVSQLMLTEVPTVAHVEKSEDPASQQSAVDGPPPTLMSVRGACSEVPPLSSFLSREQTADGGEQASAMPFEAPPSQVAATPSATPAASPSAPELPPQTEELVQATVEREPLSKVEAASVSEVEVAAVDPTEAALSHARALREEITRLTRELHSVLQPVTESLLARNSLEELERVAPLFPASLQRNAVLAKITELASKQ